MPDARDREITELSQSVGPENTPFEKEPYGEPKGEGLWESVEDAEEAHDFIAASKVEEWIQKVAQEAADRTKEIHTGANPATRGESPDQGLPTNPKSFREQVAIQVKELLNESEEDGLYFKYRVFKEPDDVYTHPTSMMASYTSIKEGLMPSGYTSIKEGRTSLAEEVSSFVFVLKPDTDHHARVALAAYAKSVAVEKPRLHSDLMEILTDRIL